MENIFNKLKLKAWLFGGGGSNIKPSPSLIGGLQEVGLDVGKVSSLAKEVRRARRNQTSSEMLDMLQSEVGHDLARHTINEAKLAKLHSILDVLRNDSEDAAAASSDTEPSAADRLSSRPRPEFVSMFDAGKSETTHSKDKDHRQAKAEPLDARTLPSRKKKRRSRLSKAMLRVLYEDPVDVSGSSDSGDNLDDDATPTPLNQQSLAWLKSRKLDPNSAFNNKGDRPRSDSFQSIPSLRESLNAGKRNAVSTYSFDDHLPDGANNTERTPRVCSLGHMTTRPADESRLVSDVRTYVPSVHSDSDMQLHYTVVDTKSTEEDSPLSQQDVKFSSPTCKYYSVPVEVSLHRINVVDVDKPLEEGEVLRTKSFGGRHAASNSTAVQVERAKSALAASKARSKSLGNIMDNMESDDEVLIVRAPVAPSSSPMHSSYAHRGSTLGAPVPPSHRHSEGRPEERPREGEGEDIIIGGEEPGEEEMSSLDFKARTKVASMCLRDEPGQTQRLQQPPQSRQGRVCSFMGSESEGANSQRWEHIGGIGTAKNGMMKCRSLDNLMDAVPKAKTK